MKNSIERNRQRSAEWRKANPIEVRRQQLWHKYKMTLEEYDNLLKTQNGVCAICQKSCPTGRNLAVDHCHYTGVIRGLLCKTCNNGLGYFYDSVDMLNKAIFYLEKRKYGS